MIQQIEITQYHGVCPHDTLDETTEECAIRELEEKRPPIIGSRYFF